MAQKHGITEAECALRWMTHHSMLNRKNGDAIIVSASSTNVGLMSKHAFRANVLVDRQHMEDNMADLEKDPLPEAVLGALDKGWNACRGMSIRYWR